MPSLALLLLLSTALAVNAQPPCPKGFRKTSTAEARKLQKLGVETWVSRGQEVCPSLPAVITELSAFGVDVSAVCTARKGKAAVFRISFTSPCKDGATDTVFMTVDTKPKTCKRGYKLTLGRMGWHDSTPENFGRLADDCPQGFRPGKASDTKLFTAFLNKWFFDVEMRYRLSADGGRFYCPSGVAQLRYSGVSGCFWKGEKKDNIPTVVTQGIIDYKCYGSSKNLRLGLDSEGDFKPSCEPKVTFKRI